MTSIESRDIAYEHNSTEMLGRLIAPSSPGARLAGIMVIHEAFGLGKHSINVAERLAAAGFAALALDLWGGRAQYALPGVMDTIGNLVSHSDDWMGRIEAARLAFATQPEVDGDRLAVIGYCFGGASALEYTRRGHAVKSAVSLHGGLDPIGKDWSAAKARVLICSGFDDPMVPPEALSALQSDMTACGVNWETNVFSGTRHSFTNPDAAEAGMPDAIAYNAWADQRSWNSMSRFLAETL